MSTNISIQLTFTSRINVLLILINAEIINKPPMSFIDSLFNINWWKIIQINNKNAKNVAKRIHLDAMVIQKN